LRSAIMTVVVHGANAVQTPSQASQKQPAQAMSGWLTKQGSGFPYSWQRRYFTYHTRPRILVYFTSEADARNKGIPRGMTAPLVSVTAGPDPATFSVLFLDVKGRTLVARAGSREEQQQWIDTLGAVLPKVDTIVDKPAAPTAKPAAPATQEAKPKEAEKPKVGAKTEAQKKREAAAAEKAEKAKEKAAAAAAEAEAAKEWAAAAAAERAQKAKDKAAAAAAQAEKAKEKANERAAAAAAEKAEKAKARAEALQAAEEAAMQGEQGTSATPTDDEETLSVEAEEEIRSDPIPMVLSPEKAKTDKEEAGSLGLPMGLGGHDDEYLWWQQQAFYSNDEID